jgi:alpha-ketoglutarate-dependent taurine dioxygenase
MTYLTELQDRGWARVANVPSQAVLLELARSIGRPLPSPTGELVKEIRITSRPMARPGTFSSAYGCGEFPLHTDTAFWPVPARYVVLRVQGDTRRCTKVRAFEDVFRECEKHSRALTEQSVWLVRARSASFYCSMSLRLDQRVGWRYDDKCMFPANRAAREVKEVLEGLTRSSAGEWITWSGEEAVVLSNWRVLHGRGPAPRDENERILERIYVR